MTESRIEKLTRISQEMAAAVSEMRAEAADANANDPETAALVEELSVTCDRWSQWEEVAAVALTHLQSAGRLIPAGGMALTAEQVEDVTAVASWALHQTCPTKVRERASRIRRALFLATEPTEERLARNPEALADLKAYAANPESVAKVSLRGTAPAEPAEEETKAEYPHRGLGDLTVLGPEIFTNGEVINWRGENFVRQPDPASSPVVPAPTETGPWPSLNDVPAEVRKLTDKDGDPWVRHLGSWKQGVVCGGKKSCQAGHPEFAPFVAAEEG